MDNCIKFCNSYLTNSHVEFIRRQTNEVAHELVKITTSIHNFCIFDEIPTCITDLIFNEANNILTACYSYNVSHDSLHLSGTIISRDIYL